MASATTGASAARPARPPSDANPPLNSPTRPPTMADFGFTDTTYPFASRRGALADTNIPPPRLSRGTTTDTEPMSAAEMEESREMRRVAGVLPADGLEEARGQTASEEAAVLKAARETIAALRGRLQMMEAEKKRDHEEKARRREEKEGVRRKGEEERQEDGSSMAE